MSDWWTPDAAARVGRVLARHPDLLAELLALAAMEDGQEPWPVAPVPETVARNMEPIWQEWVGASRPVVCDCGRLCIWWPDDVLMEWPDRQLHVCRPAPGERTGPGAAIEAARHSGRDAVARVDIPPRRPRRRVEL